MDGPPGKTPDGGWTFPGWTPMRTQLEKGYGIVHCDCGPKPHAMYFYGEDVNDEETLAVDKVLPIQPIPRCPKYDAFQLVGWKSVEYDRDGDGVWCPIPIGA